MQTLDVLCYYYFAALICIGSRQFMRAETYLISVRPFIVDIPSTAIDSRLINR